MKTVRLHRLTLERFMGVNAFELDLGGADATVRGTNGVGKTTLATAFSWLLTGKDSRGQADFEVKTLDPASGEALHNLEHAVEAVLDVDGELVTLRRAYAEVWTKKRGAAREEFTGHETRFWIDGVPCGTKREFDDRVDELLPAAAWRELTNPDAWHAQHWQKRRQDLIDICGDVSDADVIAAHPELADLPGILGKRTPDEHKKVVEARRREINAELKQLPARVDEVARQLEELPADDAAALEALLAAARSERDEAAAELARVKAGGGDAAAERRRLAEVETALTDLDLKGQREHARKLAEAEHARDAAQRELEDAQHRHDRLLAQAEEHDRDAAALEPKLQALRDEWTRLKARTFEAVHVEDACPACGQALPPERVEAAHARALEEFNARKARDLEANKQAGAALAQRQKALRAEAALARTRAESQANGIAQLQGKVANLQAKVDAARAAPVADAAATPEYARLAAERDELKARIQGLAQADPAAIAAVQERLVAADAEVARLQRQVALLAERERAEARRAELLERETTLAQEFEDLERQLHLIESFVRAKSALLTTRINSRFAMTEFRLFEEQINGGLADACVALVRGVPYGAGLNRAARINSGLDVITVLQEHHGVHLPVFVDECESVVELLAMPTQVVRLVVDERHAELTVELAGERELISA